MNVYQYNEVNVSILNAFGLNAHCLNCETRNTLEAHNSRKGVSLASGLTAADFEKNICFSHFVATLFNKPHICSIF